MPLTSDDIVMPSRWSPDTGDEECLVCGQTIERGYGMNDPHTLTDCLLRQKEQKEQAND